MSGVKETFVNLRSSDYNRMMQTCRRMDNVDGEIQSRVNAQAGRMRDEMNSQLNRVNARHDRLESAMSSMSGDMRRMETNFNKGLRNLSNQFQQDISNLDNRLQRKIERQGQEIRRDMDTRFNKVSADISNLRGDLSRFENQTIRQFAEQRQEYLGLIQQQGEQFAHALEEQGKHFEKEIQNIHQHLAAEKKNKEDLAQTWANDTEQLLNAIDQSYRHEKFKPGELNALRDQFRQLYQSNFNNGVYEAAIGQCQQTYLQAKKLQLELEHLELEWNNHLNAAKLSATELIAACEANEIAQFVLEEGDEPIEAKVDYWTEGKLSELRQRAEATQQRLNQPDNLTLDDLRQSTADSEEMRVMVELLAEQAKEALIASQLRNNIGQSIEDALNKAGWDITDAVYESEDFRRSVHVKLKNMAGDELVTIITPEKNADNTIQNHLNISFFDHSTNDENRRQESLRYITQTLQEEELECGTPQCAAGTENRPSDDKEKLDFDAVRQGKRGLGA
jgi:hypothetical protein